MGRRVSNSKGQRYNRSWEKNEFDNMVQEYDLVRDTYVVPEIKLFVEPVIEKKFKVKNERDQTVKIERKSIMQKICMFLMKLLKVEEMTLDRKSKI